MRGSPGRTTPRKAPERRPTRAARFRIAGASPSSATTSSTAPRAMASRGMPNTTQDASSWASVCAPASFISSRPCAPSSPIPVMRTPIAPAPAACAAERKSTSTLGRWRDTSGPSESSIAYASPRRRTRTCRLPGAMSARPGRTRSPSAASFTSMRQRPFRRVAKAAVNPSGMCWTTTIPGPSAGIFWSSSVSASVPPVDAPTATMRSAGTPAPGPGRGGRTASAVRRGEAVSRRLPTRASAAPRTASRKTTADSCRNSRMLILGFVTIASAPSSRARIARSVPSPVSAEHTTTGMGSSAMIRDRNVRPCMRGSSRSRTMTSGRCFAIFSMAM